MKRYIFSLFILMLLTNNAVAAGNVWLKSNHKATTPNIVIKEHQIWLATNHSQTPNFVVLKQLNQKAITAVQTNGQAFIVLKNNKLWLNETLEQPPFAVLRNHQVWLQNNNSPIPNAIIKPDGALWLSSNTTSIANAYINSDNLYQDGLITASLLLANQITESN